MGNGWMVGLSLCSGVKKIIIVRSSSEMGNAMRELLVLQTGAFFKERSN